jgi:hypothetical protein
LRYTERPGQEKILITNQLQRRKKICYDASLIALQAVMAAREEESEADVLLTVSSYSYPADHQGSKSMPTDHR